MTQFIADKPLLFAIEEYSDLAQSLLDTGGFAAGAVETKAFPDGERYSRISDDVHGQAVVLLGGTVSDRATLDLYDLACAIVKYGASRLTLVIPYFGYATMERAANPGEVVKAKTRARLLSSIPIARQGNDVVLLDLHSEGIPHYFEGSLTARHLYATPVVLELIREVGGDVADLNFVLGATDAGRAKWIQRYANQLGVDPAFIIKRRVSDTETLVETTSAQVQGRRVVLYDDMVRTGGSLVSAAKAYRAAGAIDVCAVVTHGLLVGDTLERLRDEGGIRRVACTNSHPHASVLAETTASHELIVADIAPFLAEELLPTPGRKEGLLP